METSERPNKRQKTELENKEQREEITFTSSSTTTFSTQTMNSTSLEQSNDLTTTQSDTLSTTSTPTMSTTAVSSPPSTSSSLEAISATTPQSNANKAKPSKSCILRLQSDYKSLENDPPEGVSASPVDATLLHWKACIFGPSDSEWEGGIFQMQINFPLEYPQKPPSIRFISKIFHPNVFADGNLCLDIIQDHWSPIYTVSTILTSIQSLLTDPNPASPANPEAAKLWASDKKEYRKRVRACVAKCSG